MRGFYRRHRGLHRWLLVCLALLAVFALCRGNRALMNGVAAVTAPIKQAVSDVCYLTSVSIAEVCWLTAIAAVFFLATGWVRAIVRSKRKGRTVYRGLLTAADLVLTVCVGFTALYGVNFYTDNFQQLSGVYAEDVATDDLIRVTQRFAAGLAETASQVQRDEDGVFAEKWTEILSLAPTVYENSYDAFPCLRMADRAPKAAVLSEGLSLVDFTGYYFPFTGEATVNVHSPAAFLPATAAHEMAHQRGIAAEQECNFIAVATCLNCESAVYRYSGYLLGFVHLGNALYQADHDAWQTIRDSLPEDVKRDLAYNNAYWDRYEGITSDAVQQVYDSILKGYDETAGVQSYGTVVDMLVAYYK